MLLLWLLVLLLPLLCPVVLLLLVLLPGKYQTGVITGLSFKLRTYSR